MATRYRRNWTKVGVVGIVPGKNSGWGPVAETIYTSYQPWLHLEPLAHINKTTVMTLEPYPKEFWFGWSGGGLKFATTGVSESMVPTSSYYQLFKSRVLTSSCRVPFIVWVCLCFWHAHHHQSYLPKALSSRTSVVPHYLQFNNLEQINGFPVPPFLVIHQQQCLFTVLSQGAFWTPKI